MERIQTVKTVTVINLMTEDEISYVGVPVHEAVVLAYFYHLKNYSPCTVDQKMKMVKNELRLGEKTISCGNWCALMTEYDKKKFLESGYNFLSK